MYLGREIFEDLLRLRVLGETSQTAKPARFRRCQFYHFLIKGVRIPIKYTNNGYITNIKDSNDLSKKMIDIIEMAKNKTKKDVVNTCNNFFNYNESINKYLSIFSSK